MASFSIERRIKWAGLLISAGLAIQLLTLVWIHPLSFIAFLILGCPLVLGGTLIYLYSLVSTPASDLKHNTQT